MKHELERSKYFQIIAWTTVVCFSLFTFQLTRNVQAQLTELQAQTDQLTNATQK